MTMATAARFEDVWKGFGPADALRGFSCAVPRGSITALLGRNGAGKTTALKCLLGLLRADAGRMSILGRDAGDLDAATRQRVGYVSERSGLDPQLTVGQLVSLVRPLYDRWDDDLLRDLMARLHLRDDHRIGELSLGQGRKVALVVNLAFRPDLLVLDEPAANLDAVVRREFLGAVLELFREEGLTVLLSTHQLGDVERYADRVVLIEDGACRVEAGLDDLKDRVKAIRLQPVNGRAVDAPRLPGELRRRRVGAAMELITEAYEPGLERSLVTGDVARADVVDLPLEDIFIAYGSEDDA